jgi:hypothetical protein
MTDEAVWSGGDVTIQMRIVRTRSEILLRRFSEIESGSSGIPPGCVRCARLDPGVSSLALLNPRLISVTPTGVKKAFRKGDGGQFAN